MPRGPLSRIACGSRPASTSRRSSRFGALVAEELRVRPRRRHAARSVARCRRHRSPLTRALASPRSRGEGWGEGQPHAQSLLDRREHSAVHRLRIARRVDQDAAGRVVGGDLAEPLAQPFVEIAVEALEPVGGRARGGAGEPDFDRQIEDQRQIRREIAEGEAVQRGEVVRAPLLCRSPDRPSSNWQSGRTRPRHLAREHGAMTRVTWSRRAATSSRASLIASQRSPSPSSSSRRIASAPGDPPGSRRRPHRDPGAVERRDEQIRPASTCRRLRRPRS